MIAYRGLLTNIAALVVIAVLGWHGCTAEVAYLAAAGVAGAHAWRAKTAPGTPPTEAPGGPTP